MAGDFIAFESESDFRSREGADSFDVLLRSAAVLGDCAGEGVPPPKLGELVGDKYRVHELLGAGGMGAVFRASHVVSGKEVALKWLLAASPNAAARLLREARAAARIDHPNVVDVYDLGTHRGGHFLVMELLRGQSLGARLRAGRLEPPELAAMMIPILRGLGAAHAQGIIHRDLKPENVLLCQAPDGSPREPKVLDFGISKVPTGATDAEHLTKEGVGLGTPAYMSPEQLVDALRVDARTDIYAAGVIMYEALTGQLPFRAGNDSALGWAISAQEPVPPRMIRADVPAALEQVVLRAMAKRPQDRYPNVEALIRALEPWHAGEAWRTSQRQANSPPEARMYVRSLVWAPLALVVAAFMWVGSSYGAHSSSLVRPGRAHAADEPSRAWIHGTLRERPRARGAVSAREHAASMPEPAPDRRASALEPSIVDAEELATSRSDEASRRTAPASRSTAVQERESVAPAMSRARPVKARAGAIYLADL